MPKGASPSKIEDSQAASQKAKFFYTGVFAILRRKEELSQTKPARPSQDKKSIKK
jgi:hypothetical protein